MKALRLLPALLAATLGTSLGTSFVQVLDPGGATYMDGFTLNAWPARPPLVVDSDPAKNEPKGGRAQVYARVTDLGWSISGQGELASQLQLAKVMAPEGITVTLDGAKYLASVDTPSLQASDLMELVFFASTNGRVPNGIYPAMLTLRHAASGRSVDIAARVVVTDPSH